MGHNLIDDRLGIPLPVLGADGMPVKAPRGGHGRWGSTSTPHRGWTYGKPAIFFAGDVLADEGAYRDQPVYRPDRTKWPRCEMCEVAQIQEIHKLENARFSRPLYVGGDCAAYLIGDPSLPDGVIDPADAERVRKVEADGRYYRRLDYEGGAEWERETVPILKARRVRKAGWFEGAWRNVGEPVLFRTGTTLKWTSRIHGFDLEVRPEGGGWRGWYRHRAEDHFSQRSKIVATRELAQRLTRRAAWIAKREKPWRGAAELAEYRAVLAQRLTGRDA